MENTADIGELTPEVYELFRQLVYEQAGINLGDQKMQLVRARLGKRIRSGGFSSYRAYYDHVRQDKTGQELCTLIDAISTNTTHLFRENQHFEFLTATLQRWAGDPRWCARHHEVRIWSAACSSGEEPHSIAITAHDALRNHQKIGLKILATDISTRMLARARAAQYEPHRLGTVPEGFRRRYFNTLGRGAGAVMQLAPDVQRLITFARFNLMSERFPFRGLFDVIFCRNVMIYFDRSTQQVLANKLAQFLQPGGYLLIGHSESLNAIQHPLTYVRPTIYQRPGG